MEEQHNQIEKFKKELQPLVEAMAKLGFTSTLVTKEMFCNLTSEEKHEEKKP